MKAFIESGRIYEILSSCDFSLSGKPVLLKDYCRECLVKNFGVYDSASVIFEDDLCVSAKGFEYMAGVLLWKRATEAVSIGVS